MKICILQCNALNGDLSGNAARLSAMCHKAAKHGADLCIAPAEAICGPQVGAYANQPDFARGCHDIAMWLATALKNAPALLCGMPPASTGALLFRDGNCVHVPDHFLFGCHTICILDNLCIPQKVESPDLLVHLNATRFSLSSQISLEKTLARISREKIAWTVSANLYGGFGSSICNGQSVAIGPDGVIRARAKAFAEALLPIDLDGPRQMDIVSPALNRDEAEWQALVTGTRDFVLKSGASRAVLGLSGGMDSAIVACIAVDALGAENVTGILMPSPWSSPESVTDALELANNLGMATFTLPIADALGSLQNSLEPVFAMFPPRPGDLTGENLQARLRGVFLMAFANRTGALLLNTGNKSETAMGYCTLYGDTAGAVSVVGDVFKTRIYQLARWYCEQRGEQIIPQNIFDKAPSAELRPNQKDSDSLPPYEELDPALERIMGGITFPDNEETLFEEIRQKVFSCQFKRAQSPRPLLVDDTPICEAPLAGYYRVKIEDDKFPWDVDKT